MEGPGGEVVLAHLGLAHGVEEELEVPDDAGEGGEEVVGDEGGGGEAVVGGRGRFGGGSKSTRVSPEVAAARMGLMPGSPTNWSKELFWRMRMADQTKLVRKPPQRTTMRTGRFCQRSRLSGGDELRSGEVADGLAGVEAKGEEGAHEAGEDGDGDALAEGVIALAGFGLLFGGDLVFLGVAGGSVDGYADEADDDAEEDDLAGGRCGPWT